MPLTWLSLIICLTSCKALSLFSLSTLNSIVSEKQWKGVSCIFFTLHFTSLSLSWVALKLFVWDSEVRSNFLLNVHFGIVVHFLGWWQAEAMKRLLLSRSFILQIAVSLLLVLLLCMYLLLQISAWPLIANLTLYCLICHLAFQVCILMVFGHWISVRYDSEFAISNGIVLASQVE